MRNLPLAEPSGAANCLPELQVAAAAPGFSDVQELGTIRAINSKVAENPSGVTGTT